MTFRCSSSFPDDFATKLAAHLASTKADEHSGTWATYAKGGPWHDYSALAAWARPDDVTLLREHVAAKRDGAGPFPWSPWSGKEPPARPWLVDEGAALARIALLAKLTPEEEARLDSMKSVAKKEAAAKTAEAAAVKVTAADLFSAYQSNEVSADERYKAKKLLVTGTVASIDKGPLGGISVRLTSTNPFMPVDASMEDSEKSKAGKLEKGDTVRVLCEGNGLVIGRPQLGDCTFR